MINGNYNIEKIAEITKAKLYLQNTAHSNINDLLIDSRKLISTHKNLFIALKSNRNNGHKYINELLSKGVFNFIVSELPTNYSELDANFILVKDTLDALQQISGFHRQLFNIPIIGITGSNGKTIIKEWLYQSLQSDYNICRSPKSYNSQIGVPISLFQLKENDELGIFEAGISEPEEMLHLEKIIKPSIGIITNIGEAHHQNFVDMRQKINEKLMLFVKSDVLIFCKDHVEIANRIYNLEFFKEKKLIVWSKKNKDSDLFISNIKSDNSKSIITGIWENKTIIVNIPFTDEASIENAIHVWTLLLHLDISHEIISERLAQLAPIAMRMELREGINQCSIINDSYNSDMNALTIAINFLKQQQQHEKKTIILSDILQSGKSDSELYLHVAQLVESNNITRFIGIGIGLKKHKSLFKVESYFYESTQEFLNFFPFSTFNNESILLKGARSFEFEQINKYLGKKTHQTRLEVSLDAMLDNFNYYRSLLKPDVKTMIMVKAFSYGSGSFEVANLLQFHRADYLAVAYTDEGIDLRKSGIKLPIMVMNPESETLDAIIMHNLEPEIYNFKILEELENILNTRAFPSNKPIGIHIKIDTGMHRLGFDSSDIAKLVDKLKNNSKILIKSIFSHLAASDNSEFDDFTKSQLNIFEEASNQITENFDYPIMRHISNSAAISRFPEAQYDMVRLGIGLYGIASDKKTQNKLKIVSHLKSIISQIKHIKAGESVGYSRSFIADKDMTIATIPIGYADGFDRRFSQGKGYVMIKGEKAPIIGNVCMDMSMIDINNIKVSEGDEICIFGENPSIIELADNINTIAYELLTSISPRVKRVYIHE